MAIAKTGQLFTKTGVEVKVISWQEPAKGVDDLIVGYGAEVFHQAYERASSLSTWLVRTSVQLTYKANVRVNRRFLGDLEPKSEIEKHSSDTSTSIIPNPSAAISFSTSTPQTVTIPDNAKLVCLKSPKGSGKTYLIEQIVDKAIKEGKWVILLTHRVQLGEALCQRVGLPYLTEVKTTEYGTVLGYGLCIDSLHPNSGARFNADNWEDGVVIIDEAEQAIWHMLNSDTCALKRVEILSQFKTLIQNNLSGDGQVYLADADLSDVSIDYIRGLAGFHVEPFVVVNDWQPTEEERWTVHNYEDTNPARLVSDLVNHIQAGGRPFISCSAQKLKSKWGTQNLESYLQSHFPSKKIIRIDSESVADPEHPAYGCIANLNQVLPQYDIAIASPSIETGVSIECQRIDESNLSVPLAFQFLRLGIGTSLGKADRVPHFDSVWAIAQGVQTVDSIRQVLARVRANVPRYVWAAKRGFYKCMVGNGATVKKALIAGAKNKASKNIRLLQNADASLCDLDLDTNFQPESLNTWAKRGCYINLTMKNYRMAIIDGLIAEGHSIVSDQQSQKEKDASIAVVKKLEQVAQEKYKEECGYTANTPTPIDLEYQKLKGKRAKTKSERRSERKGSLVKRYGEDVSITSELVAKDDDGWYSKILSHYYLTVGKPYLINRDSKQLKAIAKSNQNRLWLPDFNRSLLSTQLSLLEALVINLLEPGVDYRGSDPNIQLIAELALVNKRELKTFLSLTVVESDSPIKIVQKLLRLLGLKLTYLGRLGPTTQRERVYRFNPPHDGREAIFQSWLQRDEAAHAQADLANSPETIDLTAMSTIGKEDNIFPSLDSKTTKKPRSQQSPIQIGKMVQWLKGKGQWVIQATTGIIVKIKNTEGIEVMVNYKELQFCQNSL